MRGVTSQPFPIVIGNPTGAGRYITRLLIVTGTHMRRPVHHVITFSLIFFVQTFIYSLHPPLMGSCDHGQRLRKNLHYRHCDSQRRRVPPQLQHISLAPAWVCLRLRMHPLYICYYAITPHACMYSHECLSSFKRAFHRVEILCQTRGLAMGFGVDHPLFKPIIGGGGRGRV